MVEVSETLGPGCSHELGHQRPDRERNVGLAHRVHGDAEVLVMQVDPESRVEPACQHGWRLAVEDPAAGQAAGQHLQSEGAVDVACLEKDECFSDQLQRAGDDHLVGGFDRLPSPCGADMHNGRAQMPQERTRPRKRAPDRPP